MSLIRQLRQTLPLVRPNRETLSLSHSSFSVPTTNCHKLSSHRDFDEGVIRSTINHLRPFNECPVSLIKFEELSSLLTTADVDFAVHGALQDGREVTEWVFNLFKVNSLARKVFEVMHNDLFTIWHKHCNPVIF